MGLRDKATKIQKAPPFANEYGDQNRDYPQSDKQFEDSLKKKGAASIEDILSHPRESGLEKKLSRFLLPEDLLRSTAPANLEYSLQSRLESLINLIEISKELATLESESDLWESIIFSILGQVGAKEAAIFFKNQNRLELVISKGYIVPDDINFSKRSGIERVLSKDMAIHYGQPLLKELVGDERKWIEAMNPALIIPIVGQQNFLGFILLGHPVGMSDYTIDDLLYLKLLGEILGSFYDSIRRIQSINAQQQIWQTREKLHKEYMFYQNKLLAQKNRIEASNLTHDYLDRAFQGHGFLLCARSQDGFSAEFHKGLSKETMKNMHIEFNETWLMEIRQDATLVSWSDFKERDEISEKFSPEEQEMIRSATLLPIRFRGELFGIFFIFDIQKSLSVEDLFYTRNMIYTYFWFLIGQKQYAEDFLETHLLLRDPLQLVKKLLEEKEDTLKKKSKEFSVYVLQIANWKRVKNLLSKRKAEKWKDKFYGVLKDEVRNPFYFSEIIAGQFFLILEKTNKADLWMINRAVHKALQPAYEGDTITPLTKSRIYSRPEDPHKSLEDLLFVE